MLTPAASNSQTDFDYTTVITTPSHLIQKGTPATPPNLKKNKRMALPQNIGANTSSIAVRSTTLLLVGQHFGTSMLPTSDTVL